MCQKLRTQKGGGERYQSENKKIKTKKERTYYTIVIPIIAYYESVFYKKESCTIWVFTIDENFNSRIDGCNCAKKTKSGK